MNRRQFSKKVAVAAAGVAVMFNAMVPRAVTPGAVNIISKRNLPEKIIGNGDYRYQVDLEWGNLDSWGDSFPFGNGLTLSEEGNEEN